MPENLINAVQRLQAELAEMKLLLHNNQVRREAVEDAKGASERRLQAELAQARGTEQNLLAGMESYVSEIRQLKAEYARVLGDFQRLQYEFTQAKEQLAEWDATNAADLRAMVESHMDMGRGDWVCVPVVEAAREVYLDVAMPSRCFEDNTWHRCMEHRNALKKALAAFDAARKSAREGSAPEHDDSEGERHEPDPKRERRV